MINYNPPYKTLFFLCYSAVAATVAAEAGLLDNPDSSVERQSHQAFVDDYETYLADNEEHPWCGTGEWTILRTDPCQPAVARRSLRLNRSYKRPWAELGY